MSFSLPDPTTPTNGQPLDASPILANFVAIQNAIDSFDGSQIQAKSITEQALADAINPRLRGSETLAGFVYTGCVWSATSGLAATMSGGTIYVNGYRVIVSGVGSNTFPASNDTYVDIDYLGNIYYNSVSNGSASPALTANAIRVAKVITGSSSVSSIVKSGSDSLGNHIYNNAPVTTKTIGLNTTGRAIISTGSQNGFATATPVALNTTTYPPVVINVPAGYTVDFFGTIRVQGGTNSLSDNQIYVYADGTTPSTAPTTFFETTSSGSQSANIAVCGYFSGLSAGVHTFSLWGSSTSANAMNLGQCFILFMVVPN